MNVHFMEMIVKIFFLIGAVALPVLIVWLNNRKKINETNQRTQIVLAAIEKNAETDVNGLPIHLSDFVGQGHYVLADFWASWCGPCKAMMPEVMQIYEAYKDQGLQVLGVTLQDKTEAANREVQRLGITFPQIYGSTPMTTYGITAIPAYILFAPDGTILTRRSLSLSALKYKLEQLLPQASH